MIGVGRVNRNAAGTVPGRSIHSGQSDRSGRVGPWKPAEPVERLGSLEPVSQTRPRHAEERLRKRSAAARHEMAIGEHHEEGVGVLRVLVAHVPLDVELRIACERGGEIERDGLREPGGRLARKRASRPRDYPREQHRLHHENPREEDDEADRNAPIEALVPALLGHNVRVIQHPTSPTAHPARVTHVSSSPRTSAIIGSRPTIPGGAGKDETRRSIEDEGGGRRAGERAERSRPQHDRRDLGGQSRTPSVRVTAQVDNPRRPMTTNRVYDADAR